MANLLTKEQKKKIKNEYKIRWAILFLVILGSLFIIATVMLLPSYVITNIEHKEVESALSHFEESKQTVVDKEVERQVVSTRQKMQDLESSEQFFISDVISKINSVKNVDVSLNTIAFQETTLKGESDDGGSGTSLDFQINGISENRKSLVSFKDALNGLDIFSSVDLPLSNLAQETNIIFSLKITIEKKDE